MYDAVMETIIDFDALHHHLGGDDDLLRDVVRLFVNESPKVLIKAKNALNDQRFDDLTRLAHSLKGMCLEAHARPMSEAAARLEVLKDSNPSESSRLLDQLFAHYEMALTQAER